MPPPVLLIPLSHTVFDHHPISFFHHFTLLQVSFHSLQKYSGLRRLKQLSPAFHSQPLCVWLTFRASTLSPLLSWLMSPPSPQCSSKTSAHLLSSKTNSLSSVLTCLADFDSIKCPSWEDLSQPCAHEAVSPWLFLPALAAIMPTTHWRGPACPSSHPNSLPPGGPLPAVPGPGLSPVWAPSFSLAT